MKCNLEKCSLRKTGKIGKVRIIIQSQVTGNYNLDVGFIFNNSYLIAESCWHFCFFFFSLELCVSLCYLSLRLQYLIIRMNNWCILCPWDHAEWYVAHIYCSMKKTLQEFWLKLIVWHKVLVKSIPQKWCICKVYIGNTKDL